MEIAIEKGLVQSILSPIPESGHDRKSVLTLGQFLNLLKEEEDYFNGEQENTKLMITRLRKIFYDKWGWNTQLIRKAANIEGRFSVEVAECKPQPDDNDRFVKKIKRYSHNGYKPKCRLVTYKPDDRVFGNRRVGKVPKIYRDDHADVILPEGNHCDLAHVLAGLDALNHPQVVSPLPDFLFFLHRLLPYANSNADVATWLGDIATSAQDFVFAYLKNGRTPLDKKTEQFYIDINSSASDMLGNIDAYAIAHFYNVCTTKGRRVSEIFEEYYGDGAIGISMRQQRFEVFSRHIGLGEWDGVNFSRESEWRKNYKKELRCTTAFMIFSVSSDLRSKIFLPLKVWLKKFDHVAKADLLLDLFLRALKKLM